MVQTSRRNDNRGSRGELSHDAERKEDEMCTCFGVVISEGRKSTYTTRKISIVQVIQGNCCGSEVKADGREDTIAEIVLQCGEMVEQLPKCDCIEFIHLRYKCCECT